MKLQTTDTDFRDLERAAEGKGSLAHVPRLALRHLIGDHLTLLEAARGPVMKGGKGHSIEAGKDQESLR